MRYYDKSTLTDLKLNSDILRWYKGNIKPHEDSTVIVSGNTIKQKHYVMGAFGSLLSNNKVISRRVQDVNPTVLLKG